MATAEIRRLDEAAAMRDLEKSFADDVLAVPRDSRLAGPILRKIVADYAEKGVSRDRLKEFVKTPHKSVGMRIRWASPVADCPEKNLVIAIIDQAMQDLVGPDEAESLAAKRFFDSESFSFYCDKLGVDEGYGRECVNDALLFSAK